MPSDQDREPDPYRVLRVPADASDREITRAYRTLARALHPDSRPAAADAADRFMAVSAAYELLSDPARRAAYDHRHPAVSFSRPAARDLRASRTGPPPLWPIGPATTTPLGSPAGEAAELLGLAELLRWLADGRQDWPR